MNTNSPFQNHHPSVRYVGDVACTPCHEKITESYRKHPMGRSLFPVADAPAVESYTTEAHNPFESSGLRCFVDRQDRGMVHQLTKEDGKGAVISQLSADVQFALGSGGRGRGYLVEHDGFVFQSPLSWYGQAKRWDVSPGYNADDLHLDRPVTPLCLFCHSNQVAPVAGTVNCYAPPVFRGHAIGCERCHGPGEKHLAAIPPAADQLDYTIVNPRRLEPALRDAVCEQCHLQGALRIPRLGREIFDYRPGLPLDQFWAVFERPAEQGDSNVAVGHVEQMHASRCYQGGKGALGCISCHDPHVLPDSAEKPAYFRRRCLACHAGARASATPPVPAPSQLPGDGSVKESGVLKSCSAPLADRQATKPADNCLQCHMPRFQSSDIIHTAITDHRILRHGLKTENAKPSTSRPGTAELVSFYRNPGSQADEALAVRDLGVAMSDRLAPQVLEAQAGTNPGYTFGHNLLKKLEPGLAAWPDDLAALEGKGNALWLENRLAEAAATYDGILTRAPERESTLDLAGTLALQSQRYDAAIGYLQRAVKVNPWRWRYRFLLTEAFARKNDWPAALPSCRRALELNPNSIETRFLLVGCYLGLNDRKQAQSEFDTLMQFQPPGAVQMRRWFEQRTRENRR